MFIKRLLYSKYSPIILSIILGFGLSTLFRKACKKRDCIVFKAAPTDKIDNKIFKHNGECYNYNTTSISCDENKESVEIG